jgi:hypothetical protein
MTSAKQIEANRKNARKSTGPRTAKGKAITKFNAVTHGLQARHVVLPDEDVGKFERLRGELIQELEPRGVGEYRLVENISVAMWRLRRVYRIEVGMFMRHQEVGIPVLHQLEIAMERTNEEASQSLARSFVRNSNRGDVFSKLSRYETSIERSMYRAWDKLQQLQEARKTDEGAENVLTIDGTPANDPELSSGGA